MIGEPTTPTESGQEHSRRHRILSAARDHMLQQGYAATSVNQICEAAGVTKGAFFHHFESKEVMAQQLLERFVERLVAPMAFARDPQATTGLFGGLRQMLDTLVNAYKELGPPACLIGLFSAELAGSNERFRMICQQAFDQMTTGIAEELQRARLPSEFDPNTTAMSIVAAIQGGVILSRATNDPNVLRSIVDAQLAQIERLTLSSISG